MDKKPSQEKICLKNVVNLNNIKDKLNGGIKVRLRNTSIKSSEPSQLTFDKPEEKQGKDFVHQRDNQPEGGTRKMIKKKVSHLLNQNLKRTLKSTHKLVTKLDPNLKDIVNGEI